MNPRFTRRLFLGSSALIITGAPVLALLRPLYAEHNDKASAEPPKPKAAPPPKPPPLPLETVKEMVAQAHLVPGPHGFTLLHCAKQGAGLALPVRDWLIAQGVPDTPFRPLPFIWPAGTAPA